MNPLEDVELADSRYAWASWSWSRQSAEGRALQRTGPGIEEEEVVRRRRHQDLGRREVRVGYGRRGRQRTWYHDFHVECLLCCEWSWISDRRCAGTI